MPQPPQLGAETRARIADLLPQALEASLDSYHKFVTAKIDAQATREFAAHHTAAKVALAHINLLMKLASLIDVPGEGSESGEGRDIALLLSKAMVELGQFTEAEHIEEEGNE